MTTPEEDLESFLEDHGTAECRRLDVAVCFVQSMVSEMKACTARWEAVERALEEAIRRRATSPN
jgi:hypothetical protein